MDSYSRSTIIFHRTFTDSVVLIDIITKKVSIILTDILTIVEEGLKWAFVPLSLTLAFSNYAYITLTYAKPAYITLTTAELPAYITLTTSKAPAHIIHTTSRPAYITLTTG